MLVIPTTTNGANKFSVDLGDAVVNIRTYWNPTANMWFMDLFDVNNSPLSEGMAMVPDVNLVRWSEPLTKTLGEFRVFGINNHQNDSIDSLGENSVLIYFTPGEFDATYPMFDMPDIKPLTLEMSDLFDL